MKSLWDWVTLLTLATVLVYAVRVGGPLLVDVAMSERWLHLEQDLSRKFDKALAKQKSRNDGMFTVVVFNRDSWGVVH